MQTSHCVFLLSKAPEQKRQMRDLPAQSVLRLFVGASPRLFLDIPCVGRICETTTALTAWSCPGTLFPQCPPQAHEAGPGGTGSLPHEADFGSQSEGMYFMSEEDGQDVRFQVHKPLTPHIRPLPSSHKKNNATQRTSERDNLGRPRSAPGRGTHLGECRVSGCLREFRV